MMMQRFSRSWQLLKSSLAVLREDRELLVFPVLSAVATLMVIASFVAPGLWWVLSRPETPQDDALPLALYGVLLLFYLVQYSVIFFFNTALVGAAAIRLQGGDPTVADGLRIARGKVAAIFGYALIASTVGVLLAAIEERVGIVGKIVVALVGASWTVASFLVVPVLVSQDIGPVAAVRESVRLLKRTWGENIIGNVGLGMVFGLAYFVLIAVIAGLAVPIAVTSSGAGALATGGLVAVIGVGLLGVLCLAVVHSALNGIYSAALYRYATDGQSGDGAFSATMMDQAFKIR